MLPYLQPFITNSETRGLEDWVPDLGIIKNFSSPNGEFLGYSSYGAFLYLLSQRIVITFCMVLCLALFSR